MLYGKSLLYTLVASVGFSSSYELGVMSYELGVRVGVGVKMIVMSYTGPSEAA
jgi:hypothetical protein